MGRRAAGPKTTTLSWKCLCRCGRANVRTTRVKAESQTCHGCANAKKGESWRTHGETGTAEFGVWNSMKSRVKYFPSYRGITVEPAWLGPDGYVAFLGHVGRRPSPAHQLDRIDVFGNYVPGNVRWATRKEQMRNIRRNRIIEIDGKRLCLEDWAELVGIDVATIHGRLRRGWDATRAVYTPALHRLLTVNGRTQTQAKWGREIGLSDTTIHNRLGRGWTPSQAVLTPAWTRTPQPTPRV